jgi:creatinine amidohydrolase
MQTRQMALLRPEQILDEMRRCPLVYLPVGPLEWHGPHLPLGMDPLNAENAAHLAAEETGGLIFPTFYWGTERERSPQMLDWLGLDPQSWVVGMDFPANSLPSFYASEEIFALLLREQLRLAIQAGFKLVVIVSGHGSENQIAVMQRLAAEFSAAGPARVLALLPFVTNPQGIMEVGHASRIETAVMMALYPETVHMENLPALPEALRNADFAIVDYATFLGDPTPQRTVHVEDDPRRATPEQGQETIRLAAAQIVAQVKAAMQETGISTT